jgi:hypothetical protein
MCEEFLNFYSRLTNEQQDLVNGDVYTRFLMAFDQFLVAWIKPLAANIAADQRKQEAAFDCLAGFLGREEDTEALWALFPENKFFHQLILWLDDKDAHEKFVTDLGQQISEQYKKERQNLSPVWQSVLDAMSAIETPSSSSGFIGCLSRTSRQDSTAKEVAAKSEEVMIALYEQYLCNNRGKILRWLDGITIFAGNQDASSAVQDKTVTPKFLKF